MLLIVGVVLIVLFVILEHFLVNVLSSADAARQWWWTPQDPLMPLSIWMRTKGKLVAMLIIVFAEWCSLNSFTFWIQVSVFGMSSACAVLPTRRTLAILPRIPRA